MTKWKLVPVEPNDAMIWKAEEDSPEFHHGDPWYGSEPPSEGQIRAIYTAMLVAAPQPPKSEPIAYIEHHKGGDNLVWDNPGGKYSALYTAPPAPSVPDGWMRAIDEALVVHHIDIADSSDGYEEAKKKLNELLAINSDIARDCSEPPADVARDAERWLSEHDLELLVTFGMQADDCDADGHTLSKEQTRRLCELGVLRNVGFGRHEMTAFGDSIFGVYFSQGISLPLQTHAEYNAAIERDKLKGGEA